MKLIINSKEDLKSASGIYIIFNRFNNKMYVGSSSDVQKRRWQHSSLLNRNSHPNKKLQNSFNKYGSDSFDFYFIEKVDSEKLLEEEQKYIDELNPEFNIRKFASSNRGFRHTEETKIKMSKSRKGRAKTDKEKELLREANLGKIYSSDHKLKLSKIHSTMTDEEIIYIRKLLSEGLSLSKISEVCKKSVTTISNIKNNKIYKWVKNG